jgi:transcriptional regulator with XRE-family HTH domain
MFREKEGWTLEELGKKIGTTKQTIKRYEDGDIRNIPYDTIIELAKCFRVSPGCLMGWEEKRDISIKMAQKDVALSNMNERLKAYALKLSELSKSDQETIMNMIDRLGK